MNETAMTEADAKKAIKFRDDLQKLFKHPTFKKAIVEGYFKSEPARIAQALTNPSMQDEVDQRSLNEMLRGVGHLNNFLLNIIREGNTIEIQLEEHKAQVEEEARLAEMETVIDPITGDEIEVEED